MQIRDTPPNDIIIGLDLGQASDYTALSVTEAREGVGLDPAQYAVRALERWRPHRYQDVVARVAGILPRLTAGVVVERPGSLTLTMARPNVSLVVDRTGVGRAVGDLFSEAGLDVDLQLVSIHGGDAVTRDPAGEGWRVPKRDLAGVVAVALQNGRLEIADRLEYAATLKAELKNFRARLSAAGHDSYGAGDDWRQGNHDDLVLAVALSVWWGQRQRTIGTGGYSFSYLEQDTEQGFDLGPAEWRAPHSRP